jgi:multicomponent Na+:H+ antiporter subunit D
MGRGAAPLAAFKYLIVGSIGACWYLLGVGYLYIHTGTLNMALLRELIQAEVQAGTVGPTLVTAFAFCIVGLGIKVAIFPLHAWLPPAYTRAPDPVSVLLAPLSTKVAVYALLRLVFSVFGLGFLRLTAAGGIPWLMVMMNWTGSAAILFGCFMALRQRELKRMLAYIVVAEMGYFVGGLGLANPHGLTGAMLHIGNDAIMTCCLFMVAGSIAYRLGVRRIQGLAGLFRRMPITGAALVVGAISVIGVPPTCGFFSKWYLLLGALEAGHYEFVIALLTAAVVAAVLFFRVFEVALFESPPAEVESDHRREAPFTMLLPQALAALGVIVAGLGTGFLVQWLQRVFQG